VIGQATLHHVLFYGPPASGKFTVGKVFADRYGMRLVENHLTSDVATRVFARGTEEFGELVRALRLTILEAALRAHHSVVTTTAFVDVDRRFVDDVARVTDRHGARLSRVQLCPPLHVLERRVAGEERTTYGKIRDAELLRGYLATHDPYARIDADDLAIDNSALSPDEVARTVARHVGLAAE